MNHRSLISIACTLCSASAAATTTEVGPTDDVEAAINALGPGDELVLQGGTYELDERFSFSIAGTQDEPILIRAKAGEVPHLHRALDNQNIIDIDSAEHVTIRGLEFSGGSAGVRISDARFLTIEGCEIHHTGDVALRANDNDQDQTYVGLQILRNHIHHTHGTGEGMYLGCNFDTCRLADCLIEGNYVHDTGLDQESQGDGIELKEGGHDCVIRDNVIHDTKYPCILTYGVVGNGGPNIIERNAMWGCGNHAIQSAADAVIRNNLILGSAEDGIAMQPHQTASPGNLVVVHNTILQPSNDAISLRGTVGTVVIANNALYAQQGRALYANGGDLAAVVLAGNAGEGDVVGFGAVLVAGAIGADLTSASYSNAPPMDLFPTSGGVLPGAGEAAHVALDDFNGTARAGVADIGAYAFDGQGNPGWALVAAFKSETAVIATDAGVTDSAAPTPDSGLRTDSAASSDAGSVQDTGPLPGDATSSDVAPIAADGGASSADEPAPEGCACGLGTANSAWLAIMTLVLVVRRRGQ